MLVLLEAIDELSQKPDSSLQLKDIYEQIRSVAEKHDNEKYTDGRQRLKHFEILMQDSEKNNLMKGADGILPDIKKLCERWLDRGLPLDLNIIKIHPDEMPLHTVAFTERLGYDREKGLEMITMGCYNTLWDLRVYLEEKATYKRDDSDQCTLKLTQTWVNIGAQDWPNKRKKKDGSKKDIAEYYMELRTLRDNWVCERTQCIFHQKHCAHGHAKLG